MPLGASAEIVKANCSNQYRPSRQSQWIPNPWLCRLQRSHEASLLRYPNSNGHRLTAFNGHMITAISPRPGTVAHPPAARTIALRSETPSPDPSRGHPHAREADRETVKNDRRRGQDGDRWINMSLPECPGHGTKTSRKPLRALTAARVATSRVTAMTNAASLTSSFKNDTANSHLSHST